MKTKMFQLESDNPFEEQPLPKAYYFPSLEKSLSSNQRKTCLSPDRTKDTPNESRSRADARFLRESNKLVTQEIPTREDGTGNHDTSSGSQFNESWPSTDKNVSSLLPQHTPSSSSTALEPNTSVQASRKTMRSKESSQSTLSKYIERFRHGAPVSREHRENLHQTNNKDFWWLSPPSSSSTPKEPAESTTTSKLSSTTTADTPQAITRKPRKKTKVQFSRGHASRPVREVVEAMDTDNLQTRTNLLLDKSESTLSGVSTPESIPKPPSSWMLEKQKRLDAREPRDPVGHRPRLAPEDDILYQWRLSRRLEIAQQQAKSRNAELFLDPKTHGESVRTRPVLLRARTRGENDLGSRVNKDIEKEPSNDAETRGLLRNRNVTFAGQAPEIVDQSDTQKTGVRSSKTDGEPVLPRKQNDRCVNENVTSLAASGVPGQLLQANVPGVCFISDANLPSHVHMMCDIVSCSQHQLYLSPSRGPDAVNNQTSAVQTLRETSTVTDSRPRTVVRRKENEKSEATGDRESLHRASPQVVDSPVVSLTALQPEMNQETTDRNEETNEVPQAELKPKGTEKSGLEVGNRNAIRKVIGQVVSERLFSSVSSYRDSLACNTSTESCEEEEEKTSCNRSQSTDVRSNSGDSRNQDVENTVMFPSDEILIRLREQAEIYQEHIRNIDRLLEQMAD